MTPAIDDLTLSQLADGELDNPQCVNALLLVLDDQESRDRLRQHLQLRQMNVAWRTQTPATPIALPSVPGMPGEKKTRQPESVRQPETAPLPENNRLRSAARPTASLLAASIVGGLLVLTGALMSRFAADQHVVRQFPADPGIPANANRFANQDPFGPGRNQPAVAAVSQQFVTNPSQRHQIAQVFAFHESVAGPLKWYVADDDAIEVSAADENAAPARPVAVLLRLTTEGIGKKFIRDYVIVCRDGVPVTIPLPHSDPRSPQGRLYLSPATQGNEVGIRYSLTVDDKGRDGKGADGKDPAMAVLAGRKSMGGELRSLGEVPLGDRLVHVEASAWPLESPLQ